MEESLPPDHAGPPSAWVEGSGARRATEPRAGGEISQRQQSSWFTEEPERTATPPASHVRSPGRPTGPVVDFRQKRPTSGASDTVGVHHGRGGDHTWLLCTLHAGSRKQGADGHRCAAGRREMLRNVTSTRYITPLSEGGSLPGLVEADDLGTYVLKFTGAGQGRKTLVAEVVCGELARRLGFRVPRLVTVDLDPVLGLGEPDQQVQELLKSSGGTNLGMDFLSGALGFDPLAFEVKPGGGRADRVVRRAGEQRRPVLAQPQPAEVAGRRVAHRPRRDHDLAPQLARRRDLRRPPLRRPRPRPRSLRSRRPLGRRRAPPWSPRNSSPRSPPRSRTSGCWTNPASPRPTTSGTPTPRPCSRGPPRSTTASRGDR